jgi:anaerobic magnesium-protoporphyrin IX monomethyl ester cyclase
LTFLPDHVNLFQENIKISIRKMKIALVYPRLRDEVHGMWPPLGIITLGTILRDQGQNVRCFDLSFDRNFNRIEFELKRFQPDLVGVSTLTNFFENSRRVISIARTLGARTVMGGPHPSIAAEKSLEMIPELEFAVKGEGEKVLPELVSALEQGDEFSEIPGLAFRQNEEIRVNPWAGEALDLDTVPIPDRDLLDVHHLYLTSRAVNLHVSRGCPFRCRFCQPTLQRIFGKKMRFRSPELVVEELKQLHDKYRVSDFFFNDDIFTTNRKWLREISTLIQKAGFNRNFRCVVNSRVDIFDEETAEALKGMGCYYILFGIESGSQEILDSLEKGITVEQTRTAFALCKRYGFRTHAYVLLGAPGETRESLRLTEELIEEIRPDTVHISICTPLLGTYLMEDCQKKGLINVTDLGDLDYYLKRTQAGKLPLALPDLTYEDVLASRARILERRRRRFFIYNLSELTRDLIREPSLRKIFFRYSFYRKMRHYFG